MGIFGRKSGITRRILGVLGRMRAGCVGVEVENLFLQNRLGVRRLRETIFFSSPRLPKTRTDTTPTEFLTDLPDFEKKIVPHSRLQWIHRLYLYSYSLNCNPKDISASPCNNRAAFPSPLLRQRAWARGSQQEFERTPFNPKPQHL